MKSKDYCKTDLQCKKTNNISAGQNSLLQVQMLLNYENKTSNFSVKVSAGGR